MNMLPLANSCNIFVAQQNSAPPLVDWSGLPTLVLLVAAVVAATAVAVRAVETRPKGLPGPPALPLLGTRWLFWSRYKMNKLHEAYADMLRRYGPVFAECTPGGVAVVSIADRTALEAVLRTPAKRPYRPPTEIVQVYRRSRPDRYASTGLVNEQGEKWHHLRRHLTAELTSPHTMHSFLPLLNSTSDDFLALLQACRAPDGTVLGFDQLTNRMGLESVCGLMLGTRLGFLERCMNIGATRKRRDRFHSTAGIETLANSLVFLLYLLSGRPDWQERIRSEVPCSGELHAKDIAAAPSVRAAAMEAFRLLPTAPFLARLLEAPMNVAGHKLPAGTFVLAHTGAACRHEENFWRADEYLPERWVTVRSPHAAALVAPFGRGRRMCPGKRFVESELYLLLAKIMQRWRVEYDGELDIQFDFLLSPKSPVSLRLVEW
ncbi:hypothetical protein evm_009930 [Chilo suppressalis]|nr:hypothetical protein evm_009930 [Chilo suppressalis]